MSLQLERKQFAFAGHVYTLQCNMAALEDLQDAFGGNMDGVRDASVADSSVTLLSIMLNRWAAKQDWPERWTPEQLKEELSFAMLAELDVLGMLFRSLTVEPATPATETSPQEDTTKN